MIRQVDTLGVEVLAELAEDVIVADLLEIRHDDRLGIGVGLGAGESELLRRPQAEELVATGVRLKSQFLVEDELLSLGATFSKVKNWGVHTVADGQLITGQNPASSGPAAKLLIDTLNKKAK